MPLTWYLTMVRLKIIFAALEIAASDVLEWFYLGEDQKPSDGL
jgi:hypothetical protein